MIWLHKIKNWISTELEFRRRQRALKKENPFIYF